MLGHLGFAPWQYALAFGGPCIGGLSGPGWPVRWWRASDSAGCC